MAFTKITNQQLNSRGATTLPNVPTIPANALKQEFDAPAKEIVAPAVNNLIDELEAETAAASIGIIPPEGRTGDKVQSLVNELSSDLADVEDATTDIVVGDTTITLGNNDSLELEAGANVLLEVDEENKKIKIVSSGGSGGGTWGLINGDIEDQEDLYNNFLSHNENRILGATNLIKIPYPQNRRDVQGKEFEAYPDGTVKVKPGTIPAGGITQDAYFTLFDILNIYTLPEGTYFLSGCPEGGSSDTYSMDFHVESTIMETYYDCGEGVVIEIPEFADISCHIVVTENYTPSSSNPLIFKPMLTTIEQRGCEYIRPVMSNRLLTDEVIELKNNSTTYIYRTGVTVSAGGTVRIPAYGTNDLIREPGIVGDELIIKPICDYKSDGTPYKFTAFQVYDGYAAITLAEAISNVSIGVEVTTRTMIFG